jgi:uncharacterized protein YoxC
MDSTSGLIAAGVCVVIGVVVIILARQIQAALREVLSNHRQLARDLTGRQDDIAKDLLDAQHGLANQAQQTFISLTTAQHDLFRDLTGARQGLQETTQGLREIMHQLESELADSISELHQLRDVLNSQRLPEISKQRVLSLEAVALRERGVSEIWVLAVTIEYELAEVYLNVIAENLKKGKRYTYFFPTGHRGGPGSDVRKLIRSLEKAGVPDDLMRSGLRIFEVDEPNLLSNVTIHDPNHGRKRGFILPVLSAVDDGFQVRLDDELYDRIVPRMFEWIETARLEYPTDVPASGEAWPR